MQVRLGDENQGMLVNGTFLYRGGTPVASQPFPTLPQSAKSVDLGIVRRGGRVQVWIDGEKILDVAAAGGDARPGVGVAFGSAAFTDARVRNL